MQQGLFDLSAGAGFMRSGPFTVQQSLLKHWHWHIREQQSGLMIKTMA